MMRTLALLACFVLAACVSAPPRSTSADEQALLRLHDAALRAHVEGDVEALLATQADHFVLVNRGEVSSPSEDQRREFLGPYLAGAKFEFYRDAVPPIVKVSRDGSLGWVIAQVEARGVVAAPEGGRQPLQFVVAWIELYERQGREWVSIGNVASFKGE
jgi:hypothetical protein